MRLVSQRGRVRGKESVLKVQDLSDQCLKYPWSLGISDIYITEEQRTLGMRNRSGKSRAFRGKKGFPRRYQMGIHIGPNGFHHRYDLPSYLLRASNERPQADCSLGDGVARSSRNFLVEAPFTEVRYLNERAAYSEDHRYSRVCRYTGRSR